MTARTPTKDSLVEPPGPALGKDELDNDQGKNDNKNKDLERIEKNDFTNTEQEGKTNIELDTMLEAQEVMMNQKLLCFLLV